MKASHTYVLIFDQIYLNLWLTKKTIIEFNHTTIDRGRKRKQFCKTIHLLHSREPFCLHPVNKIESYESKLLAKVPHPIQSDHYERFIKSFFFFCFITQAPLRQILTIFSFGITIQHLQLRGIIGSNILDKVGVKKK